MQITERQQRLLEKIIKEFVATAQPVSSKALETSGFLDVSSATIRGEMNELERMGYLEQPHTSAGRVPTDKGYRLFVDSLKERNKTKNEDRLRSTLRRIVELKQEEGELFAELARAVAVLSGSTVFSGPLESKMLYKAGMNEVLSQPELADFDIRSRFGDVLDSFEENVDEFARELDERKPTVFIGKENPIVRARNFSMIASRCRIGGNEDGIIVILGPTRMNYKKNLEVLDTLLHLLS